ncbi:hypothetical protein L6303_04965 [archaeon]|nr:hypothetical protein [Nanoarchaeota archaeon]MBU4451634.1 hypothetical protein [Nanoarchaeota archaeon]MCG2724071.1 hypothetical protein [archaeon]
MALPFDIDIYNGLLGTLGVQPTGDPVADAVYLVLLPMVVIYLFIDQVIRRSRFGENTKVKIIMMFITAFTIIHYKYYGLFAAFSMPLLVFVILWHTLGFVFGKKDKNSPRGDGKIRAQVGSGGGFFDHARNLKSLADLPDTVNRELAQINDTINRDTKGDRKAAIARITILDKKYDDCDLEIEEAQKVRGVTGSAGHVGELMEKIQERQTHIANEAIELMVDNKISSSEMRKYAEHIYPNRRREIDRIRY